MGKEFNNEQIDGLFAGTPPLEALRFLIHEAAVSRAFFEADSTRDVCVELPEEACGGADADQTVVVRPQHSVLGFLISPANLEDVPEDHPAKHHYLYHQHRS